MAELSTSLLSDLTEAQREAVDFYQGPLLILAGPGSGKTRVVTRRIARLIERGVYPSRVLAITFTNRAAREMQERVDALVPGSRVQVSTFHRFCAWVLRRNAQLVGLDSNYVIFDKSDQLQVIRAVLHELDLDAVRSPATKIGARISQIKNASGDPESFIRSLEGHVGQPFDAVVAQVFPRYQQALLQSNAVDFDDLLLHVVRLFRENEELRSSFDQRFQFVLVDEYQDTNPAQYQLVRAVSVEARNVCVTGDPDQSIYGWRGAHIENILNFERDYPDASLIRLEQNFRSTKSILYSADRLIEHNRQRKAKSLISTHDQGDPVRLLKYPDSQAEADGIARRISRTVAGGDFRYSDIAVFYRVNSMSRELELALTRHGIPYQVAAGVAFYDRAEIRDLLAYLRLIDNPSDQVAFQRIVNRPARGIGAATQTKLQRWANENRVNLLEAARSANQIDGLSKTARQKVTYFARMIDQLSLADSGSVADLLKAVIDKSGFARTWSSLASEQAIEKQANVEELINAAAQYDALNEDDLSLTGFLETTSLINDGDQLDPLAGQVTLMTLHAAKGLEFPVVFIVGLEQGLIPHDRSIKADDPKQLEEERRLLFVGITRAMRTLFLTTADKRSERGSPKITIPSPFLTETVFELVDESDGLRFGTDELDSKRDSELRQRLRSAMQAETRPVLTTGAALLNGTSEEASLPTSYPVGSRVRHPQYGHGTVVRIGGFSKRRTVTVEFDDSDRQETFVAARCPLQPVGGR